jgi:predicted RNase H-like nuclease (RuvC/YqgF family)
VKKSTYTKEELNELAKGVFATDKTSPSIYANEEGTFRNAVQYEKMSDEDKAKFPHAFKNPHVKQTAETVSDAKIEKKIKAYESTIETLEAELESAHGVADEAIKNSEAFRKRAEYAEAHLKKAAEKASEGSTEISRLNGLLAERDAEIADLKAKLSAASSGGSTAPAETTTGKSTTKKTSNK